MTLRLPYPKLSAPAVEGLKNIAAYLDNSALDAKLLELVYLRVSQINGCSFCLLKHVKILREKGEADVRIDSLAAWYTSEKFDARERAALKWAEAITHIAHTHAPDELYQEVKAHFSDNEMSDLTIAICNMNAMNRLAISMRL